MICCHACVQGHQGLLYLFPGFDTLVSEVRIRGAGNEASSASGRVQVPILQNNLPLADDQHGCTSQLHALEHIILRCLEQHNNIMLRKLMYVTPVYQKITTAMQCFWTNFALT